MQAFNLMSIVWVAMVLSAKGMWQCNIHRFEKLYEDVYTIVVVNNNLGRKIKLECSLRQGDPPSSLLFDYGVDPILSNLDAQLKGILI